MAIVIPECRAIYYPIPKVANSSIRSALWLMFGDGSEPERPHRLPFQFVGKSGSLKFGDYFRFAFVRNPWDKLVSCYSEKIAKSPITNRWLKNGVYRGLARYGERFGQFYADMPFDEFVKNVCRIPDGRADIHIRSQWRFVKARDAVWYANRIFRFEDLNEQWAVVCSSLGKQIELPWCNKSTRSGWREVYTKTVARMVADRYEADITLFQYKFD